MFVQTLDTLDGRSTGLTNLIEMTVDRDYGDTMAVSDGKRMCLVSTDLVFPDMEAAVRAVALREGMKAAIAETDAKQARRLANYWLLRLEDFD